MGRATRKTGSALLLLCLAAGAATAQSSGSFKLEEHTFNAGGNPSTATLPTSASFRITLDSIGDPLVATGLGSPSFRADASFVPIYRPPGEVADLRFGATKAKLLWDAEPSRRTYNLYRDSTSNLAALAYGACEQQEINDETTTDTDVPSAGDAYFYLVTAENRIGEEGTKGFRSDSTIEREGTACP